MNVLDENIPDSQRQLLRSWRLRIRQIGHEVGRQGMEDEEVIPLLHRLGRVTFFTRDLGFYDRHLCHADYCLACLAVGQYETASFIRRFLRHPAFNTRAKRMGTVIRVSHAGLHMWQLHAEKEEELVWHT
jgi:hypothetical protein